MFACCFSDGMMFVVVMATCEGFMPLFELVMLFRVLYRCLVKIEWSRVCIERSAGFVGGFFTIIRSSLHLSRDDLIKPVSKSVRPSVRTSIRPSVHNQTEWRQITNSGMDRGR